MLLSGCMAIRNGVALGYPFIESILSLLPLCDELVISEGYSDDDTFFWLQRLAQRHPKIRLERDRWPEGVPGGGAIGQMQTQVMRRCRGDWCYLLQADEIMPEENVPYLRALCQPRRLHERLVGRRRFNSYHVDCLHVTDHFQRVDNDYGRTEKEPWGQRWAVRLVHLKPPGRARYIHSGGDGWSFEGIGCFLIGVARLPRPIWHLGYNFPVNVWRKRINHAQLYADLDWYHGLAEDARRSLEEYERGMPAPLPTSNPLGLPPLIAPLIGSHAYSVREELLD